MQQELDLDRLFRCVFTTVLSLKKKKKFHSPQIGSQSSEVYEYVHLFP